MPSLYNINRPTAIDIFHFKTIIYELQKLYTMGNKYSNKYRIPSARWQQWDYRWSGAYFITICSQNREHYFGNITNGKMQLSDIGIIADVLWYEIKNHAKNMELGEFVVMPNHVHLILILNGGDDNVETGHALSLQQQQQQQQQQTTQPQSIGQQRFQNIGKNSVSSIIGSYKSAVSKHAHRLGFTFEWQTRFHDHIIRDNAEYQRIVEYIQTNPQKWNYDSLFNQSTP